MQEQIDTKRKWVLGANGNRWKQALEQMGTGTNGHLGRMSNFTCPKSLYAKVPLFSRAHLLPVLLCFGAHLPQLLFASEPFYPDANFPRCLLLTSAHFPQVTICIRLVLHLSQQPICSDAHFYWCPLPLLPIPQSPFFPNAILVPYKNVRFHAVP